MENFDLNKPIPQAIKNFALVTLSIYDMQFSREY